MTAPAEPGPDAEVQAAIAQLTARNYADSDAAGYIDRTGLETTK